MAAAVELQLDVSGLLWATRAVDTFCKDMKVVTNDWEKADACEKSGSKCLKPIGAAVAPEA
eukprot:9014095-Alexandrium_andersonii.AAC.1